MRRHGRSRWLAYKRGNVDVGVKVTTTVTVTLAVIDNYNLCDTHTYIHKDMVTL